MRSFEETAALTPIVTSTESARADSSPAGRPATASSERASTALELHADDRGHVHRPQNHDDGRGAPPVSEEGGVATGAPQRAGADARPARRAAPPKSWVVSARN